jgi:ABC-type glycerol-3-phosphate transport system permease component
VGLRLYLSTLGTAHWNYLIAATRSAAAPPLVSCFTMQGQFVQGAMPTELQG